MNIDLKNDKKLRFQIFGIWANLQVWADYSETTVTSNKWARFDGEADFSRHIRFKIDFIPLMMMLQ